MAGILAVMVLSQLISASPSVEQSAAEFVKPFLDEVIIEGFADFDNHLDNVRMDWRNIGFFHVNEIDKVK